MLGGQRRMGWLDAVQVLALGCLSVLVYQSQQSVESLRQQLQAVTGSPSPASSSTLLYTGSTYLGDGLVMCYVRPLGIHMVLEGADQGMTPHLCRGTGWEPDITTVFKRLVKRGYHVLDVGTNIGYYTAMFSMMVGSEGAVIGIEASPRTYSIAERTLEMHGMLATNTKLLNRAAYTTDNVTVTFSVDRRRPLNNHMTLPGAHGSSQAKDGNMAKVLTITIDTAVAGWDRLDFIKVDVEGAEADAYKGMKRTIQRFPNLVAVIEVNTARMGVAKAQEMYTSMQRDYPKLRRIDGDRIVPTSIDQLLGNLVSDELVVLSKRAL